MHKLQFPNFLRVCCNTLATIDAQAYLETELSNYANVDITGDVSETAVLRLLLLVPAYANLIDATNSRAMFLYT